MHVGDVKVDHVWFPDIDGLGRWAWISVQIRIRNDPERNSSMTASRSSCGSLLCYPNLLNPNPSLRLLYCGIALVQAASSLDGVGCKYISLE